MILPLNDRSAGTAVSPAATIQTSTNSRSPDGTLRLRGASVEDRRVRWGADVIDNEGMGKKKSKGVLYP